MTTLFLLRHGRSTSNTAGTLAGRKPGVDLDELGVRQAQEAAARLREIPFAGLVSSPLERCQQTIAYVAQGRRRRVRTDADFVELDYGSWSGRQLKDLAKEDLWKVVQSHPSAVTFPGRNGESMLGMQHRAVRAVHRYNARFGPDAMWLACSHGDVIKAILADALGIHLDQFQRIVVDTASISVIHYTPTRPFVITTNSKSGDLQQYVAEAKTTKSSDAVVGGSTGHPGKKTSRARR